jgi:hypothetical protein
MVPRQRSLVERAEFASASVDFKGENVPAFWYCDGGMNQIEAGLLLIREDVPCQATGRDAARRWFLVM